MVGRDGPGHLPNTAEPDREGLGFRVPPVSDDPDPLNKKAQTFHKTPKPETPKP